MNTNNHFPVHTAGPRPGDPAKLIANSNKLQQQTNWKPKYNQLTTICESAYKWEREPKY